MFGLGAANGVAYFVLYFSIARGSIDAAVATSELETSSRVLGVYSTLAIAMGDVTNGAALLELAIDRNPQDVGAAYHPETTTFQRDIRSEFQVIRMLIARPAMASGLTRGDTLYRWAAHRFGAFEGRQRVSWNSREPEVRGVKTYGMNIPSTDDGNSEVFVRSTRMTNPACGQERSFEALWSTLVFELHNVARGAEFESLHERARMGAIERDQYVEEMFSLELKAAQETRAFYLRVYLPWATARGLRTHPKMWYTTICWGSSHDCFGEYIDRKLYPWVPYLEYFDSLQEDKDPRRQ